MSIHLKVRETPTVQEVLEKYGEVKLHDEHFFKKVPAQARAWKMAAALAKAAEELLADPAVSLNRITTALVAERVGTSIGTFYNYFEDIIALLDYVWPERTILLPERIADEAVE